MTIDRREEQQHNLKLAELLYAAFDQQDLAILVKLLDEKIEVRVAGSGDAYEGHKGFGRWYQGSGGHKHQVTDVVPVGPSRLVVVTSGGADLLEFEEGKVVGFHVYSGKADAVEAAKKLERESDDAGDD